VENELLRWSAERERMATLSLAAKVMSGLKRAGLDSKAARDVVQEALGAVWEQRELDTPERGWDPGDYYVAGA
jgi:hypothetical protein